MPPLRRRSRSRGRLREERSHSSVVAVDVADGVVAREYLRSAHGGATDATAAPSSPEQRRSRSRSLGFFSRPRRWADALRAAAASALLPAGYPLSVTDDYLGFQVFDSLQGLCSYVRGVCSSAAVLSGLGVGSGGGDPSSSSSASSTLAAAAAINAARDSVGMLAGFFLAAAAAPGMDADAKRWRLAADASNDLSLVLEVAAAPLASAAAARWFGRRRSDEQQERGAASLLSSFFFRGHSSSSSSSSTACAGEQRLRAVLFALLVCLAAAARALTGVAGGATRAALTAHFCRGSGGKEGEGKEEEEEESSENENEKRNKSSSSNSSNSTNNNNAGDVAAKEGSQEAACTLVGMLLGLLLTRASATNPRLGAFAFALLTVLHLYFNAKALRCLRLTSLNRARLELVVEGMVVASGGGGEGGDRGGGAVSSSSSSVLTPADAAALEPLWPPPFLSFSRGRNRVVLGASLGEVAEAAGKSVEDLLLLRRRRKDDDDGNFSSLPFVAAFCPKTKRSLVALRSDCSPSEEVAAFVLGLLLSGIGGISPEEAESWLRRRWFGDEKTEERGRRRTGGGSEKKKRKKPLAELLLERAGWDPIGRCGASLGAKRSNLRYELLEGRREKGE